MVLLGTDRAPVLSSVRLLTKVATSSQMPDGGRQTKALADMILRGLNRAPVLTSESLHSGSPLLRKQVTKHQTAGDTALITVETSKWVVGVMHGVEPGRSKTSVTCSDVACGSFPDSAAALIRSQPSYRCFYRYPSEMCCSACLDTTAHRSLHQTSYRPIFFHLSVYL